MAGFNLAEYPTYDQYKKDQIAYAKGINKLRGTDQGTIRVAIRNTIITLLSELQRNHVRSAVISDTDTNTEDSFWYLNLSVGKENNIYSNADIEVNAPWEAIELAIKAELADLTDKGYTVNYYYEDEEYLINIRVPRVLEEYNDK